MRGYDALILIDVSRQGERAGDAVRDGGRAGRRRRPDRGRPDARPPRDGSADRAAVRQVRRRLAGTGVRRGLRARGGRGRRLRPERRRSAAPWPGPPTWCSRRSPSCSGPTPRMHELSIATRGPEHGAQARRRSARSRWSACGSGSLRQVVPDSLRFYFEIVARDTALRGRAARAGRDRRRGCTAPTASWSGSRRSRRSAVPECGVGDVAVIAGEELEVEYIEVEEQETACIGPR